jgi:hypothetical protein
MSEGKAIPADDDSKLIAAIEACDFRYSDCNCINKPVSCRQAGYVAVVELARCRECLSE